MDVDWSETQGAIPVSTTYLEKLNHDLEVYDTLSLEMVPVVFITNKVFEKIYPVEIPTLATRLARRFLPAFDITDIMWEKKKSISAAQA